MGSIKEGLRRAIEAVKVRGEYGFLVMVRRERARAERRRRNEGAIESS